MKFDFGYINQGNNMNSPDSVFLDWSNEETELMQFINAILYSIENGWGEIRRTLEMQVIG